MGLSTSYVRERVAAMRLIVTGAVVVIRHEDREYTGVRTSLDQSESVSSMGAMQQASGAARLIVSELASDHPKAGDTIEVKEHAEGDWETRVVVDVTYDQTRATLRLDYGERYG